MGICTMKKYNEIGGFVCSGCKHQSKCKIGEHTAFIRKILKDRGIKTTSKKLRKIAKDTFKMDYYEIKEYLAG